MNYWDNYFSGREIIKKDLFSKKCLLSFLTATAILLTGIKIGKKEDSNALKIYNFDIGDLQSAIVNNDNLNKNEKKIILNAWDIINDNINNINYVHVIDVLSSFDIKYPKKNSKQQISTAATWNFYDKTMRVYNSSEEEILKRTKDTTHELMHLMSVQGHEYPAFLQEGMASFLCSEYINNNDAYNKQRLVVAMMCEIINPNIIAKSYFQENYSLIQQEFLKIDDDNELFLKLTDNLNEYQELYIQANNYYGIKLNDDDCEKMKELLKKTNNVLSEINSSLVHYFKIKTGKEVDSSLELSSNLNIDNNIDQVMSIYSHELIKDYSYYNDKTKTYYTSTDFLLESNYFNKENVEKIKLYEDYFLGIEDEKGKIKVNLRSIE